LQHIQQRFQCLEQVTGVGIVEQHQLRQ
jgi:hypothetical protein